MTDYKDPDIYLSFRCRAQDTDSLLSALDELRRMAEHHPWQLAAGVNQTGSGYEFDAWATDAEGLAREGVTASEFLFAGLDAAQAEGGGE